MTKMVQATNVTMEGCMGKERGLLHAHSCAYLYKHMINHAQLVAAAVAVLEEAAALSLAFQRSIALKLPHHASSSSTTTSCSDAHALRKQQQYYERMRGLFLRLLGCDAGLTVLEREGWLARIREEWALTNDAVSGYAHAVERRLMQASFAMADGQTDKSFTPLPLLSPAPASQRPKPTPPPIVLRCQELAALCPGSGPAQDLRALLALPWRIQVRIERSRGGGGPRISPRMHAHTHTLSFSLSFSVSGSPCLALISIHTHTHTAQVQAFPDDDTSETDEGPTPAPTALLLELDTTADIASSLRPFPRWAEDWDEVYGPTAFRVRGRLLDPITGTQVSRHIIMRACGRLFQSLCPTCFPHRSTALIARKHSPPPPSDTTWNRQTHPHPRPQGPRPARLPPPGPLLPRLPRPAQHTPTAFSSPTTHHD